MRYTEYPNREGYISSSGSHEPFPNITYIIGHKSSLNQSNITEIILCTPSGHRRIKPEIGSKRKHNIFITKQRYQTNLCHPLASEDLLWRSPLLFTASFLVKWKLHSRNGWSRQAWKPTAETAALERLLQGMPWVQEQLGLQGEPVEKERNRERNGEREGGGKKEWGKIDEGKEGGRHEGRGDILCCFFYNLT